MQQELTRDIASLQGRDLCYCAALSVGWIFFNYTCIFICKNKYLMMQIYLDCNFLFENLIDLLYTGVEQGCCIKDRNTVAHAKVQYEYNNVRLNISITQHCKCQLITVGDVHII